MKIFSFICYSLLFLAVVMYCYDINKSLKDDSRSIEENIKEVETDSVVDSYDEDLENYVLGVLACEMPALYDDEALKAQAIAARTFALQTKDYKTSTEQCFIDNDTMKKKWGDGYEKYYSKLLADVMETKNIIIKKNNEMFKPFYFSMSNGYTINSKAVFNEGNINGVVSSWDKNAKNYEVETIFTKEKLDTLLGDFTTLNITKRDNTNHVLEICIDTKCISGIEFRKLLELRSTDFKIENLGDKYTITTYGYGHGVGMSQNGANYLAMMGYDYKYILNYYYQDVEFVSII